MKQPIVDRIVFLAEEGTLVHIEEIRREIADAAGARITKGSLLRETLRRYLRRTANELIMENRKRRRASP